MSQDDRDGKVFQFENQTHTIGNLLRVELQNDPDVFFCGMRIPCPTETNIQIRLIVKKGVECSEEEVVRKGVANLTLELDELKTQFELALTRYHYPTTYCQPRSKRVKTA